MAITLAEAKVGMADKVDQKVVDEFRRSSKLLDALVFDNAVSPTGGSTLVYGYQQLLTPSTAGVRAINTEYTPNEAKRTQKTTNLKVMGGKIQIDRVLIGTSGAIDELDFQLKEKSKATANKFDYLAINGNSANSGKGELNTFDGLDKLLTGTQNEVSTTVDVSTTAKMDTAYNQLLDDIDATMATIDGKPSMLLMNDKMLAKVKAAARRAGYYSHDRDEFGRQVEYYNGVPMVDLGKYYNGTTAVDIIPTDVSTGKTSIYAITIDLDAFHGVSPQGSKVISTYLPDLNSTGAVKDGEVELIASVVLKNTNKAAVLRDIKIA